MIQLRIEFREWGKGLLNPNGLASQSPEMKQPRWNFGYDSARFHGRNTAFPSATKEITDDHRP